MNCVSFLPLTSLLTLLITPHASFQFPFRRNRRKRSNKSWLKYKLLGQEEEEPLILQTEMEAEKNSGPTILVTGGAGYIGTHCIIQLLENDFNVVAIDNFTNAVRSKSGNIFTKTLRTYSEIVLSEISCQNPTM